MILLGIAFFLSGAAALVYQVVWQRILTLHTGIGIVSVSLIVAAFMAGLGLGSHVGGVLSARVSPRRALRLFALIEVAVGLFAAVSCRLYYDGFGAFAAGLCLGLELEAALVEAEHARDLARIASDRRRMARGHGVTH